jgi:hypothetical protein
MAYLGLVPSERSIGDTLRRGGITKTGNGRVRHMLVESAWTYRHPPKIGVKKLYSMEAAPPKVREIVPKPRWPIWLATRTASPSPTAGWSRSTIIPSRSNGRIIGSTHVTDTRP